MSGATSSSLDKHNHKQIPVCLMMCDARGLKSVRSKIRGLPEEKHIEGINAIGKQKVLP